MTHQYAPSVVQCCAEHHAHSIAFAQQLVALLKHKCKAFVVQVKQQPADHEETVTCTTASRLCKASKALFVRVISMSLMHPTLWYTHQGEILTGVFVVHRHADALNAQLASVAQQVANAAELSCA